MAAGFFYFLRIFSVKMVTLLGSEQASVRRMRNSVYCDWITSANNSRVIQ